MMVLSKKTLLYIKRCWFDLLDKIKIQKTGDNIKTELGWRESDESKGIKGTSPKNSYTGENWLQCKDIVKGNIDVFQRAKINLGMTSKWREVKTQNL